jgi:hypothetical protein
MKPKRELLRRRCCECRDWYTPKRSAAATQKTCGRKCGLRRRGRKKKARREEELSAAREAERERQRAHRERQRILGTGGSMSRPSLSAQAADAIEEIIKKLGQAQRLSRTGLRRQLRRLSLGEPAPAAQEVGT